MRVMFSLLLQQHALYLKISTCFTLVWHISQSLHGPTFINCRHRHISWYALLPDHGLQYDRVCVVQTGDRQYL